MSKLAVSIDEHPSLVEIEATNPVEMEWSVHAQGELLRVIVPQSHAPFYEMDWLIVNGKPYEILFDPALHWIQSLGRSYRVHVRDLDVPVTRPHSTDGRIKAPIPGQINRVLVEPGQHVESGSTVLILEAMKMENHILAGVGGVVNSVGVSAGQTVTLNQVLVEIKPTNE